MNKFNKQTGLAPIVIILAIVVIGAVIAGGVYYVKNIKSINKPVACTMEAKICPDGSSVGRTGPNCEFSPCPLSETSERQAEFSELITMSINDKVIFSDGLFIILKEINDSRCKPGLQCFWQGELSVLFYVNINGFSEEVRLGTVNNKKASLKGYTFSLESATENSAMIIVSVNLVGTGIR